MDPLSTLRQTYYRAFVIIQVRSGASPANMQSSDNGYPWLDPCIASRSCFFYRPSPIYACRGSAGTLSEHHPPVVQPAINPDCYPICLDLLTPYLTLVLQNSTPAERETLPGAGLTLIHALYRVPPYRWVFQRAVQASPGGVHTRESLPNSKVVTKFPLASSPNSYGFPEDLPEIGHGSHSVRGRTDSSQIVNIPIRGFVQFHVLYLTGPLREVKLAPSKGWPIGHNKDTLNAVLVRVNPPLPPPWSVPTSLTGPSLKESKSKACIHFNGSLYHIRHHSGAPRHERILFLNPDE
ncbi:hypothetical protein RUM43_013290 [Polyplax serrata]|uniref:Uncharacterized protein n=1 Tax=Polyplax serrata TaxID=468196 RepID=A0AAN8P4X6_POLSC